MTSECILCPAFGKCGGCDLLDIEYGEQLALKQREVEALFEAIAPEGSVAPILGMSDPVAYRNKVIAPFAAKRAPRSRSRFDPGASQRGLRSGKRAGAAGAKANEPARASKSAARRISSGMYAKGTHDIIDVPGGCMLENPLAHRVVEAIISIMLKHGIEPYDEDRATGFLRHAVIRVGHNSGEALVTLVTNAEEFPHSKSFCRELVHKVPEITSVVQNINLRQTNVVLGERERTLFGPGFILDELCGAKFRLSSRSFYQVNATQTEVLYKQAMLMAGLGNGAFGAELCEGAGSDAAASAAAEAGASAAAETGAGADASAGSGASDGASCAPSVIDAYCGTGTIGIIAAKFGAGRVLGVDSVDSAIRDARQNARHNGVDNAEHVCADAADFMSSGAAGDIDVAFIDPPRAGSSERFLNALAKAAPGRIVYISCNPTTQARDVKLLIERGYKVEAVQPVDMFPHTRHVETVCLMSRR